MHICHGLLRRVLPSQSELTAEGHNCNIVGETGMSREHVDHGDVARFAEYQWNTHATKS